MLATPGRADRDIREAMISDHICGRKGMGTIGHRTCLCVIGISSSCRWLVCKEQGRVGWTGDDALNPVPANSVFRRAAKTVGPDGQLTQHSDSTSRYTWLQGIARVLAGLLDTCTQPTKRPTSFQCSYPAFPANLPQSVN